MHTDPVVQDPTQALAVVGMAGRFPDAPDVESFWRLMMERHDAIGPVPASRWDSTAQLDPQREIQAVGGFLTDVDRFDATFFGISPREAEMLDPQQRLMLEAAWRALEDAGTPARALAGSRTGVFVGAGWHDYEHVGRKSATGVTQHTAPGYALDMIAARVSYFLGLTGPSLVVETGCSSALVAAHLAAQALRAGEVDAAIIGGVALMLDPTASIGLTYFGGLSPDGRCKAFGAGANGFVRGEGVGALFVKTLARAQADGDRIHGVIAGTAVNNDGGGQSVVAPSPLGQERLLRDSYRHWGIPADRVAYVEAHGTGTSVGDPIEAGAVGRVLGQTRSADAGPLPIGSVKTNIGHLEAAAGIPGLFKALLALRHGVVPPSLHSAELNPEIAFDELNVTVVREPLPLPADEQVFLGVSSFGWGGTNAHVVLTGAPRTATPAADDDRTDAEHSAPVLLPVSAHSEQALAERARELRELLTGATAPALPALAGTLAWQRDQFPVRAALLAADAAAAAGQLERLAADPAGAEPVPGVFTGRAATGGRTAFVFPGQGSQWHAMGRELLAAEPVFAAVIHRCAAALEPYVDWDLVRVVSGEAGEEWLSRIDMLQPTLWAVSLGLCELWRAAGVEPDVVVGHSQGEVTAATAAGILSYEDGAMVVARRSAIARRTSGKGRMLAVDLSLDAAKAALSGFEEGVSLAVNNGPNSCVLSGDTELVLALKELLEAEGTFCRLVNVDYASHSPQMDELEDDLLAALRSVRPGRGAVELMSTVRVAPLEGPELDARYWVDNLRRPVMFADAMERLFDNGVTHVVEISPHPVLTPALEQLAAQRPVPPQVLSTLRRDQGSPVTVRESMARAYVSGLEPFGALPRTAWAPVPPYPWQRAVHWVEQGRRRAGSGAGEELRLVPSVTEQGAWTGMLELAPADIPWVRDHRVYDAVVLPGTGMLELALRTALARTGGAHRTLAEVGLHSHLTLTEEPVTVALGWRDDVTGGGSFTLSSLEPGGQGWVRHASARVLAEDTAPDAPSFPERLLGLDAAPAAAFYADCAARGLNYGPAFQGVVGLRAGAAECLAEVRLPEGCLAGGHPHRLHPALWDAALQASIPLFPGEEAAVPVGVGRVHLHQDLAEPVTALWSHAVRRDGGEEVDLFLFDAGRRPVLSLLGLRMRALAASADPGAVDAERIHRLEFRPKDRAESDGTGTDGTEQRTDAARGTGRWAVCAADQVGGTAAWARAGELAEALDALGGTALAQVADGADAARTEVWQERLASVEGLDGVVFLAPDADAGPDAQRAALTALAALVRACSARPLVPRLVVVTADAQLPPSAAGAVDPGAALYWGFGRVLRREHPELRPVLVDVAGGEADWAARCAVELSAEDGADQVVLRGGERLVGRLVRGAAGPVDDPADPARPRWRSAAPQPFRLAPDGRGTWDGLAFRPLERRAPGAGEIELAVGSAALNFIDVMKVMGTYPDPTADARLLGLDGVGVVTRTGAGVTRFAPGDRVVACTSGGALATHWTVLADHAQHVPEGMADADAAAFPAVTITAWYGLRHLAALLPGETVLIHSAAGGLGLAAIAVARLLGAEVLATAGSAHKRARLRELGVRHVFDSRDLSWADEVRAATGGRGVDVVLNSLTGAAIPLGLEVLAEGGRFVEVGKADIYGGRTLALDAFRKGIGLASLDLAGVIARRPALFTRLFAEVWERVEAGELAPLPVLSYPFARAAEALREMSHGHHIGKFVLSDPSTVTEVAPEPLRDGRFRGDGTYLITGGLGALGLSLAEFMAGRGAGRLALVGRSAPGAEAVARIGALRARGVLVETFAADVADAAAVRRVREQLPPLRGVVHAAGLLDDATVLNLTAEQLDRVLAPKVDGAVHLDAATEGDPLDFFLLFSSAAALFGNAGQAAYAAGNAFMDALAVDRRRRGLPALSVQWGPFSDVGLAAAEDNRGARLAERGMAGFSTAEAWRALEGFLGADEQVVAYVPIDLRQYLEAYPDTATLDSWSALRELARHGGSGSSAGAAFLAELRGAPQERWPELLEAKVQELAGRVLRLEAGAIDRDTPFKSLGLDSLMGLELRNRLEAAFGLRLSPTLLWTYGSARALSAVLAERLLGDPAAGEDGGPADEAVAEGEG
ncbi:type I polyketide synthase [Kitasatospora purpeofusca]|uniref:Type I polyketide synthase n=1 Tax=Kitasatospora purpeofusca TaxID=67352 RepID=A0ABZ1UAG9_9ACTN|nr:type I polyketide synthase [Kitasatospora purpeofusca]